MPLRNDMGRTRAESVKGCAKGSKCVVAWRKLNGLHKMLVEEFAEVY